MPTGEDAQMETILLDPTLSFGLVGTTSKTKSYSDIAVAVKSVPNDTSPHIIAISKNKLQPTGVTFLPLLRLRFTAPAGVERVAVDNKTETFSLFTKELRVAMHDPSDTTNDFNNTGENMFLRNVTKNIEKTIPPNSYDYLSPDYGEVDAGDIIEVGLPYKEGWEVVTAVESSLSAIDIEVFHRVDATIYHDGSLTGGEGVECSFEVYDEDGSTLLGKYTFEGLVNPFVEESITKGYSIKAGLTRLIEADCGDYVLDPSAPDHYLRAVLVDIKDRATGSSVDLSEFDYLAIGLQIKDPDTEEIIASVEPEEVTSLPFTGSWSGVISAPSSAKTYKAILVLMVNPKQAKRYEADCIIQLGM